jgi:hypothetical protein
MMKQLVRLIQECAEANDSDKMKKLLEAEENYRRVGTNNPLMASLLLLLIGSAFIMNG